MIRRVLFVVAWELGLLVAWAWLVQLTRLWLAWRARADPGPVLEYLRTLK